MEYLRSKLAYQPLAKDEALDSPVVQGQTRDSFRSPSKVLQYLGTLALALLIAVGGFSAGLVYKSGTSGCGCADNETAGVMAPRIPTPRITGKFIFGSPFSKEPPQKGNESEPIWDALVPNGLGYFKDYHHAPKISIPTVFHQLHCLYIVRRAYYSRSNELEEFDFGKNRSHHASHCFDYLEQSITCSSDSTVEPGEDDPNGFLGSGFPRQCRSFEDVKDYVEKWRVFNATGFLAHGLDHGQAHVN
ncbi:hypothetical protein F4859DRAFT_523197 [Xylaria cf. heliscus]|nr:hypothetical protein F4859DRAFT_523197 [Xylaria cf. heliscus]